ncbi:hypothetical protein GCM10023092_16210 [Rurimicrobium arvi]|uniref:Uncharacterized protein n=1 Tax=Rurimicrobium arvi TaxID=2049916 RepID=A0ABP8MSZ2_9BACT
MLLLLLWLLSLQPQAVHAQQTGLGVDLSLIDGVELTPANIFNYRLENRGQQSQNVLVRGRVYYRQSALNFTYEYHISLQPGVTQVSRDMISAPVWNFSSPGLKELFQQYNKLPQGTYEYCVSVYPPGTSPEYTPGDEPQSCVYQTVDDLFLINLLSPDNDAKIYEYNPMLSWVVNYPFASELTYRLRVAELKTGQNPQNAITRNNAMYQDNNVMSTSAVYPVTARPLQKWQPYVWTVDAYYKGILLGGAEVWKFTIIDDSEYMAADVEQSYYEFDRHNGDTRINAYGSLCLKYISELNADTLNVSIVDNDGSFTAYKDKPLPVKLGDNRIKIELEQQVSLKHEGKYTAIVLHGQNKKFIIPFTYYNPLFLKNKQ